MKKLLIAILVLLTALSACSPEAETLAEETAAVPTETSLEAAPTTTDKPTAEPTAEPTATPVPTATATIEPSPTASPTAEPTPTEEPQSEAPATEEAPLNGDPLPQPMPFPDGAVIIFTQSGGFAGLNDTWVFYEDGRTTLNGIEQAKLSPEKVSDVLGQLDALGFFEIDFFTKPGTICCDFFEFTIAARTADKENFAGYSEGDETTPANLRQAGSLILMELVQEAQLR
jgi:hypothetical protein